MTTTNNMNNNHHVANIVEKIMMDGDENARERDSASIPGLNDMPSTTAPALSKTDSKADQGTKAPSSTGNSSSIWSRMKSSFYTSGGKAKQDEQELAQAANRRELADLAAEEPEDKQFVAEETQSFVNKSEANLAEALRRAREEEEKWQITNLANQTAVDNYDDNLVSEADSLVGGTIIVPDGGELSVADKDSVSPGLSFRASMADISLLEDEGGINEKQTSKEKDADKMAAAKETSAPLPDGIGLLGSTIESLIHEDRPAEADHLDRMMPADADDAAKVNGVAMLEGVNNHDASDTDDKAKDESAPIVGPGNIATTGSDDETFGQAFVGIGEQMFLSDAINEAPGIAPEATTAKINDESAAPLSTAPVFTSGTAGNVRGRSMYHLWILAFGGICITILSLVWSHYNVEGVIAPVPEPSETVDFVLPEATEPVHETPSTSSIPTELSDADLTLTKTSCVVNGVEYAFGTPYYNSDGCNYCICGRRCTSESCSKTTENDVNDIVPSSDAKNQATSSSPQNADETPIEAETEDSSDLGRVGATPELLGSYAFAFVAALISLLGSSLLCFAKKLTSRKKTLRKGAQSSATTPSREVRHSGMIGLSDRACTPRPGLARTPVTETPTRRSRISTRRKNHDEKDIIASTVKLEVRTRKGRWVEARRSGRILNYGSPMKATKRE